MRTLDNISLLLKEQKKTQKSLMDHLCLSKNIFTDWKSGKCKSYNNYLPQIAEFFNVSIDYLVGRTSKQEDLEEGSWHGGVEQTKKDSLVIPNKNKNPEIQQIIHKLTTFEVPDDVIEFINNALDSYNTIV